MLAMRTENNLIWLDLEMTGLDCFNDTIIEIATVITDSELNELAVGPVLAISQPQSRLDAMDEWNQRHHGRSGLIKRVQESSTSMSEAEQATLDFVSEWTIKGKSPLCGNSICQDRRFMAREMPQLEAWFHYRQIDVSTLKELARRWQPEVYKGVTKQGAHLALEDIRESIEELRYYRQHLFV
jgi:oligoribonuclease